MAAILSQPQYVNYVGCTGLCLPWGRFPVIYAISRSNNDEKWKYNCFPKKSAYPGLNQWINQQVFHILSCDMSITCYIRCGWSLVDSTYHIVDGKKTHSDRRQRVLMSLHQPFFRQSRNVLGKLHQHHVCEVLAPCLIKLWVAMALIIQDNRKDGSWLPWGAWWCH